MINQVKKELRQFARKEKARILQRFFKTGPGEYGEGDIFLGVVVPDIRKIAQKYQNLPLSETLKIIRSPFHEERLLALLVWVIQYAQGDGKVKKTLFEAYCANTAHINNWDLVDLSAYHIVGAFLADKKKQVLKKLARSSMLWERRIAIIATFYYIRQNIFAPTLTIARILLHDKEDLIHKAVGWMLREVGKRDLNIEEQFLKKYYRQMPRTMLRYAIEKFPAQKRKSYLAGNF